MLIFRYCKCEKVGNWSAVTFLKRNYGPGYRRGMSLACHGCDPSLFPMSSLRQGCGHPSKFSGFLRVSEFHKYAGRRTPLIKSLSKSVHTGQHFSKHNWQPLKLDELKWLGFRAYNTIQHDCSTDISSPKKWSYDQMILLLYNIDGEKIL